jgi:hypothetical protein
MKILLSTLFLLTFIHAKGISLLLPHQYDTAMHFLKEHLKKADNQVTLISPYIQSPQLEKILVLLNAKNIPITLMTNTTDPTPSRLVQYKNINLYQIQEREVTFTLVVIDDTFTCKMSLPFDEEIMKSKLALFECSTTKYSLQHANRAIKQIERYTSTYLEEDF